MPRIRTVKPDLAKHEGLFDAETETGLPIRYVWAVLPCFCDREGRFEWRQRRLNADILPYDTEQPMPRVLDALLTRGFIAKYRVGDEWFGFIPTFTKHQVINNRESDSDLPPISDADEVIYQGKHELPGVTVTREPRVDDATATPAKGKGRERKGKEGKGREGARAPDDAPPPPKNSVPRPDDIDEQTWSDFLAHRRAKKARLTPSAWKAIRKQLDIGIQAGHDPNEMLAVAMAAGWQGFEFDWYLNRTKGGGSRPEGDAVSTKVRSVREFRERQARLIEGGRQ